MRRRRCSIAKQRGHPARFLEQRLVCGTDRGHLALLCQLLQLVRLVLRFYESLLHVFQGLDKQRGGVVGGLVDTQKDRSDALTGVLG